MAVTMEEVSEKEIEIRCVCNQASNRCTRQNLLRFFLVAIF